MAVRTACKINQEDLLVFRIGDYHEIFLLRIEKTDQELMSFYLMIFNLFELAGEKRGRGRGGQFIG